MTRTTRHFTAVTPPHRGSLARYGTTGSLVLWGLTLAGVPFYVLTALIAGSIFTLIDRLWPDKARRPSRSDAISMDGLSRLLHRLTASLEGAQRAFVSRRADRIVVSLLRQGSFSAGEAIPSQGARQLLVRLAQAIEAGSWRIDVIGHGDGEPAGDATAGALVYAELSASRARATVDMLRDAGCHAAMVAAAVPLGASRTSSAAPERRRADAEPAAIDIVIRRAGHETQHAA